VIITATPQPATPEPNANCVAVSVRRYNPKLDSVGNPLTAFTDPTAALGIPQGDASANYVALGIGGSLELNIDPPIQNTFGLDMLIHETSPDGAPVMETARVQGSFNGFIWLNLGTLDSDGWVDLGLLPYIRYVRIIDETDITGLADGMVTDGYDVDALQGVRCSESRFTRWSLSHPGPLLPQLLLDQ